MKQKRVDNIMIQMIKTRNYDILNECQILFGTECN